MSILFDATDDYLDMGNVSALNNANTFTLMAWVSHSGTFSYPTIIAKDAGDEITEGFRLHLSLETLIPRLLLASNLGNKSLASSIPLTRDGQLFHVACSFSNTAMEIFVDGVSGGSMSYASTTMKTTDNPFLIGDLNQSTTRRPWSGLQEDVRYYERVVPINEVKTIVVSRGHDQIFSGLVARWLLAEKNSGAVASGAGTLIDSMGLSNGTPYGSPVYDQSQLSYRRKVA